MAKNDKKKEEKPTKKSHYVLDIHNSTIKVKFNPPKLEKKNG